jgi:hypothetical protein
MYSTSNAYKTAIFNASNLQWGYSIKANNVVIDSSTADKLLQAYQQSSYYMNSLSIGNVVSQYINMTLRGTSFSLTDSVIEPSFVLGEQSVPMGKFNVFSAPVENGNTVVTAYDNVKKLDRPYTSVIAYPAMIAQVVDEIATLCGVTFDTTGIMYPNIAIPKAYTLETCTIVMSEVCKLIGCNLVADRNGNLVFRWFTSCGVTYPIDNHWSQRLDESDYTLGRLSCTTSDGTLTSGDSGGTVLFSSDYMIQAQLNSIRTAIAMTYRGANIEISGDPSIDPWDIITVTDLEGNTHAIPVMNNILTFDGAIKNAITAYAQTETEAQYGTDSSGTKKLMEIQKSIDGIRVNLKENYTDNSQIEAIITATAEQISTEVAQSTVSGAIAQLGAYTVTITTPEGTTYDDNNMSKTLTARVLNMQSDITTDLPERAFSWTRKSVNTTADAVWNSVGRYGSTLAITSADYDDNCSFVCDVYINDAGVLKDTNGNTINDTNGNPIPILLPRLVLRAELPLQSSFKQVKSTMLQLSDKILLQIDNNGKLTSINLETGQTNTITLTADNINFNGMVTANRNVVINPDGTITAVNGIFNGSVRNSSIEFIRTIWQDTEYVATIYCDEVDDNLFLTCNNHIILNADAIDLEADIISCSGDLYLSDGSIVTTSDRDSKDKFTEFDERFYRLAGMLHFQRFVYKTNPNEFFAGVVAQELKESMEICNIADKEFKVLHIDKNGKYGVRYDLLYALVSWYSIERLNRLEERLGD